MSLFNFQGSFALSQECLVIISQRFAFVKGFFQFFEILFSAVFDRNRISLRSFWALGNHITSDCLCQELFLSFLHFFQEDTSSRCRSLECLHILPQEIANVNTFLKVFRHILQRSLAFLVRYATYSVFLTCYTLYIRF